MTNKTPTITLTKRQKEVFDFFIKEGGFHLSKTAEHFKVSTAAMFDILQILVRKGVLVHLKGEVPAYVLSNNIKLITPQEAYDRAVKVLDIYFNEIAAGCSSIRATAHDMAFAEDAEGIIEDLRQSLKQEFLGYE